MTIIAICGQIGSGKDTAAEYLINNYGYHRESFASTLKDSLSAIFGWDRIMLEGLTVTYRQHREQVDEWWAERLNIPQLSPRWVMQHWGTDVCRNSFHNDIWVASLENKLRKITENVVISDCRFPNELSTLKKINAKTINVRRGKIPDWYDDAILANSGDSFAKLKLKNNGIHESEYSLIGQTFDYVIENNSTIDDLYNNIFQIVKKI